MTEPQQRMLRTLADNGGSMFRGALLHRSGAHASGYRVLDRLQSNGFIEMTTDYGMQGVFVRITNAGKEAIA